MRQDPETRPVTLGEFRKEIRGLDDRTKRMALDLVDTKERLARVEETMATKADVQRILGAIDSFAGKLETYGRETLAIPATLDAQGKTLRDHEQRLRKLETA